MSYATARKTGLMTDHFFYGVQLGDLFYLSNGLNRMICYDLVSATNMGILPPPVAATDEGTNLAGSLIVGGKYKPRFEYYNINKKSASAFSPLSAEITVQSNGGIRVNIPADAGVDSQVTHIRAYLTADAGSVYRYDGEKAYTGALITYDFTVAEAGRVTAMGELNAAGNANVDVNLVPPTSPFLMSHQNRLWFFGNIIYKVEMAFTNGSKTVTGSGFVSGMRNMYCHKKGDARLYVIDGPPTSATSLELTEAYDGTTGPEMGRIYGEDSILFYSHTTPTAVAKPESVPATNWIPVNKDDGIKGTGFGKVGDTPIIGKQTSLYILSGDRPANYRIVPLNNEIGLVSQRSGANNDKGHFIFAGLSGAYITDSQGVFSLTDGSIQNIWTGEDNPPWSINKDRLPFCHGVYDRLNKRYMLWVASSGSNKEDKCLVYDFKKIGEQGTGWSWWNIEATCSAILRDNDGKPWVCWMDANGFVYKLDSNATNDGAGMSVSGTRRGTATGGTTTTLIDTGASFDIAGDGLKSIKIKILAGTGAGQERIISSNTVTAITITVAWTTIPDATSVYAIGYISAYRKTGWLDFGSLSDKFIRRIKMVFKVATSTYSAELRHYTNFSASQLGDTKHINMADTKGYHDTSIAMNRAGHHQLEFGLFDTDRVITIKEVEIEGGVFGRPTVTKEARA